MSTLFEWEIPAVTLADKFGFPPLSVLDRRGGEWKRRRSKWDALGMQSELGRDASPLASAVHRDDFYGRVLRGEAGTFGSLSSLSASVFDPVLCEMVYRWWSRPGDRVLDPFAGGSVRGVVASTLARWYTGIDLRNEQVEANRAQAHLGSDIAPEWIVGDSTELDAILPDEYEADLIFSCPPYGDLERYSDDPADLSAMQWDEFVLAHGEIVRAAASRLRPDRFAVWVISDIRDGHGDYRGLPEIAIQQWRDAGLTLRNDLVLLDHVGPAAARAERPFRATRTLTRVHQRVLVLAKGSASKAARRIEEVTL